MAQAQLIAFDRPLTGAIHGRAGRFCTDAELAERDQAAYRRGVDDTRSLADQQLVEFRADIGQLSDGILKKLSSLEVMLVSQLRTELPALAVEIARRLLAGYEPTPEVVAQLCTEALDELFPERENLELVVSPRDAALLDKLRPEWQDRYPGLRIRGDTSLTAGDCQVRSRFGLTDARLTTKLSALTTALNPA